MISHPDTKLGIPDQYFVDFFLLLNGFDTQSFLLFAVQRQTIFSLQMWCEIFNIGTCGINLNGIGNEIGM